MALNDSKSVTAHKNSIKRTVNYVYKLLSTRQPLIKGWDKKTNKIHKIVQSKIKHKSSLKAIKASMIKQGEDEITK